MKTHHLGFLLGLGVLLASAGCASLDLTPAGDPDRVLNGTVNPGSALPAGAEVVVRLIAMPAGDEAIRPPSSDMPVVTRPAGQNVDQLLGESVQTLASGTTEPVAFRLAYHADDATLRRGLNLEARISIGGKLRFRTVNAHVVTLASSAYPHELVVQPVGQ